MHKVLNYGSALQAYATQKTVEQLGYHCELIDYIYPNKYHKQNHKESALVLLKRFALHLSLGFPYRKKRKKFEKFRNNYFQLSQTTYNSLEEIAVNSPLYDIYMVGSDQVWNPKHIGNDTTFLLSFATNEQKKISYASSFAQANIEKKYRDLYSGYLSEFESISVREANGQKIIKEWLNKDVPVCLDPTLLLNKEDYLPIAGDSALKIGKPFVLVYILQYAYNPYPYAAEFVKQVHRETGLHVVLLDFTAKEKLGIKNVTNLHDAVGPSEFLYLFMNASLVITTSFHGTAFALNFEKPLYAIINDKATSDDRMLNLLTLVGAENRAIKKNAHIDKIDLNMNYAEISPRLNMLCQKSVDYLQDSLK